MYKRSKFVIHDHDARRAGHHFDFRIEWDGVLKSWAIPKARLPEKGDKVLSIQVPDHPMSYYNFTGEITDTYGRGTVRIHDKGPCIILAWKPDRIGFDLKGKVVKGTYWLIKLASTKKEWLLIKGK